MTTTNENTTDEDTTTEMQNIVIMAKQDLAARLKVSIDTIADPRIEEKTWSDGSLGLPEPGCAYTMALVPGYRLQFDLSGVQHVYHTSNRWVKYAHRPE